MKRKSSTDEIQDLHPSLEKIMSQLGIDSKSQLDPSAFQKLIEQMNNTLNEIDLDRDLLERSLKLASDEMQDYYLQLAQSAKMASIGEMAGGIAHEINNPLQIIVGSTQLLTRELKKGSTPPSEMALEQIKTIELHVKRIAKIVRGLQTLGRDASEDMFAPNNLKDIFTETLELCKARIQNGGIELRLPAEVPSTTIYSKPSQISQVLINLLNNAYDAIQSHSEEPASSKWIEMQIIDEDSFIELRVLDSGPGVPADLEEKIMRPFFTTKLAGKGTGLGLSVSVAIAKDHGGSLHLDRSVSASCFVFRINKNISSKKAA